MKVSALRWAQRSESDLIILQIRKPSIKKFKYVFELYNYMMREKVQNPSYLLILWMFLKFIKHFHMLCIFYLNFIILYIVPYFLLILI